RSAFPVGGAPAGAELAEAAAWRLGIGEADVAAVRRAALVHDLGRVAVSTGTWEKPGPLTTGEWERVRMHPYFTERVLARCDGLGQVVAIAARHHERLDGSRYHRGARAPGVSRAARTRAAPAACHAMGEARPPRPAHTASQVARSLDNDVVAGRLDGDVVAAVLQAAGMRSGGAPRAYPAGLTGR